MDEKITLEFDKRDIDRILDLAEIHSDGIVVKKITDEECIRVIAHTELLFLVRITRQELGLDMREEDKL